MPSRPLNAAIAVALSLMPLPAMALLDHLNRGCGDGLCGFFSGLLILGGLATATMIFMVRSARRGESPMPLRLLPLALWLAAVIPLLR